MQPSTSHVLKQNLKRTPFRRYITKAIEQTSKFTENIAKSRQKKKYIYIFMQLRIHSSLIRSAIWLGRELSLGTKVTTSDNFCAGFKTLSFSQPVLSLFAARKGTNPETAGRTAIENIYVYQLHAKDSCFA